MATDMNAAWVDKFLIYTTTVRVGLAAVTSSRTETELDQEAQ